VSTSLRSKAGEQLHAFELRLGKPATGEGGQSPNSPWAFRLHRSALSLPAEQAMRYVYILRSISCPWRHYVGVTLDPDRRRKRDADIQFQVPDCCVL